MNNDIKKTANVEPLANPDVKIYSPFPLELNDIYFACENGEIYRYKDGIMKSEFNYTGGNPRGIAIHGERKKCYIADKGKKSIFVKDLEDKTEAMYDICDHYEGEPHLGPNSIVIDDSGNAGEWGETSIESPKGSVYMIDIEGGIVKALAHKCLAMPTGMALANNDQLLYVCETGRNRILRFIVSENRFFNFSVFFKMSGRFGPTSIAVHNSGNLYVSHWESRIASDMGEILVINHLGELLGNVIVPDYPEILGMNFEREFKRPRLFESPDQRRYVPEEKEKK